MVSRPGSGYGGVSNVDMDRNNTLQIKAIGVAISTFETLPFCAATNCEKLSEVGCTRCRRYHKMRWNVVFLERVPTGGADVRSRVKQDRLLRSYDILHLFQQSYLFCMAQSQLSNGCWTLQSLAGDYVALDHLLTADSDVLDNEASLIVYDA